MLKRYLSILLMLMFACNTAMAEEFLLSVTPVNKFTTTTKHVHEGDEVKFKVYQDTKKFKKGDILTATLLQYEENGFSGKCAEVTFGDFKLSNGKRIKGNLYINGNDHGVLQEFINTENGFLFFMLTLFTAGLGEGAVRGGEVILVPDKNVYEFFTEE